MSSFAKVSANNALGEEPIENSSHETTLVTTLEDLNEFELAIEGKEFLVIDAEGVDLSRTGRPTLFAVGVSNGVTVHVFLFDLLEKIDETFFEREISTLKTVLEDASVTKIIHDCRQDSDALNEFHQITLRGVFDTSVYNMQLLHTSSRDNLNNTLAHYHCTINPGRKDRDFYINNPNYWANRPLTADQITCAAADISSLFDLREKMLVPLALLSTERIAAIKALSEKALDEFRSMRFHDVVAVPKYQLGRVIGTRGSVIAAIQTRTGAMISKNLTGFKVLGKDQATVDLAKRTILDKAAGRGEYY